MFRCSCQLSEHVEPALLQAALEETLLLFPYFRSTIKKGFFWYYLEQSSLTPLVAEEERTPCSPIYAKDAHGLLFEVSYYRKRINLEIYHALTDGTGGLQFLQQLLTIYLQKRYKQLGEERYYAGYINKQATQDGYSKYYHRVRVHPSANPKAHQLRGERFPGFRFGIIECLFSAGELRALAKRYQVSVSVLLTSYLIESIHEGGAQEERGRPIVISLPVNLRSYFPSESLRNFFSVILVQHHYNTQGHRFEDVLKNVKEQFERLLSPKAVEERMSLMTSIEKTLPTRLLPLVLKAPSLRLGNSFFSKTVTAGISNLGEIKMPDIYLPYIELFEVSSSTSKLDLCLCSHQNTMALTLISSLTNTRVQRNFVRRLVKEGISVTLDSNFAGDEWGEWNVL